MLFCCLLLQTSINKISQPIQDTQFVATAAVATAQNSHDGDFMDFDNMPLLDFGNAPTGDSFTFHPVVI